MIARHILYRVTAAVVFVPFAVAYGAGKLAEWLDGAMSRLRRWAYAEQYGRWDQDQEQRRGEGPGGA